MTMKLVLLGVLVLCVGINSQAGAQAEFEEFKEALAGLRAVTKGSSELSSAERFRLEKENRSIVGKYLDAAMSEYLDGGESEKLNLALVDTETAEVAWFEVIKAMRGIDDNEHKTRMIDHALGIMPERDKLDFINSIAREQPYPEVISPETRDYIVGQFRKGKLVQIVYSLLDQDAKAKARPRLERIVEVGVETGDFVPLVALALLGRDGHEKSVEILLEMSQRLDIENGQHVCDIPLAMAATGDERLIAVLVDMLRHNNEQTSRSDTMPPFLSFAHTAAVGLSWVVEGFPEIKQYVEFTPELRLECIFWLDNNEIKIKDYSINKLMVGTWLYEPARH